MTFTIDAWSLAFWLLTSLHLALFVFLNVVLAFGARLPGCFASSPSGSGVPDGAPSRREAASTR